MSNSCEPFLYFFSGHWFLALVYNLTSLVEQGKMDSDLRWSCIRHYNFTPISVCHWEMGDSAGFCCVKALFIPLGILFGSREISSFLLGGEKVRTLQEDQDANSKDRNNCLIKQPWAPKLRGYSFVLVIDRNCEESLQTFDGFKFFAKYFKLLFISVKKSLLRALKRDPKRGVLITVSRVSIFFAKRCLERRSYYA